MATTKILIPVSEEMYHDLAGLSERLQVPAALVVRVALGQCLLFEKEKAQLDGGESEELTIFGLTPDEFPEGAMLNGLQRPKNKKERG